MNLSIKIDQLSKTYRGNVQALKALNLEIGTGMFGLLGPNGAGKTTLMKIMATIMPQTAGDIFFDDVSITRHPERIRPRLGYLPQQIDFYPKLTVWETLDYLAELSQVKQGRKQKIATLLEQVNLVEKRDTKVCQLSGGMKRRLGIAQALLNDPELLIVDEPTAGLDPEERVRFRNYLSLLSGERVVMLSTHIVEDVASTCNDLAVIFQGQIRFTGDPATLIKLAQGKVWSLLASQAELNQYRQLYHVVSAVRISEGWQLRLIADEAHISDGTPEKPTIEDSYMFLMKKQEAAS
jgi:ABC-type multidrug transport system ATPase subunit